MLEVKNVMLEHLYHKPTLNAREVYDAIKPALEEVRPYVTDTFHFLHKAVLEGKGHPAGGPAGPMKDPDHGIYPMVVLLSSGRLRHRGRRSAPYEIKDIVCVSKAYSSAVGAGAFVSEFSVRAQTLRIHGGDKGEFGATTGRPRRMGWYDCVASRYGVQVQGATQVALTVVDALSYLDEIPVCVAYEVDGKIIDFPPPRAGALQARLEGPARLEAEHPGASPSTRTCPRPAGTMWSSSSRRSACGSPWSPTAPAEEILHR